MPTLVCICKFELPACIAQQSFIARLLLTPQPRVVVDNTPRTQPQSLALLLSNTLQSSNQGIGCFGFILTPIILRTETILPQSDRSTFLQAKLPPPPPPKSPGSSRFHEVLVVRQIVFEDKIPWVSDASGGHKSKSGHANSLLGQMHPRTRKRHALSLPMGQSPR